jgi:uncharacterized protein
MTPSLVRILLLVGALCLGGGLLLAARPAPAPAGGDLDPGPDGRVAVLFPAAGASVWVELARTDAERQRGLMGRAHLPDGEGMLFVFPAPVTAAFWMKDTPLPLSIAFIDERGTVIDIQDMQPFDESLHYPAAAYQYALEVPQGWFARAGVTVGQQARLPAEALAATVVAPALAVGRAGATIPYHAA